MLLTVHPKDQFPAEKSECDSDATEIVWVATLSSCFHWHNLKPQCKISFCIAAIAVHLIFLPLNPFAQRGDVECILNHRGELEVSIPLM